MPTGQGVRQKDRKPVVRIRPRSELIEQQIQLKLRNSERRGEDLKPHNTLMERPRQFEPQAAFVAFAPQFGSNAPGDLKEVRTCTAARIENDNIRIGETARTAKLGFQEVVNALDLVADDFRRCIPDSQILAQLRVEGFEKRLIEIRDGGDCRLTVELWEGHARPEKRPVYTIEGLDSACQMGIKPEMLHPRGMPDIMEQRI